MNGPYSWYLFPSRIKYKDNQDVLNLKDNKASKEPTNQSLQL